MISVIIPTYNREKLISRAIKSVMDQTYKDIEVIVIDDASNDNTEKVVSSLKYDNLYYYKLKKNGGACKARNFGIDKAKGDYISFLDSDDEWEKDKLEKQYNFLKEKNVEIVSCNYFYEKNGSIKRKINYTHDEKITLSELLNENIITTGSILISKQIIKKIGNFDEKLPRYQDWDLVIRLAKEYDIYFLNDPLLTLHFQANSITSSTSKQKKYYALECIYIKNEKELKKDKKAYAHICWSMGMYSLYTDIERYDLLKKGIVSNGINIKRLLIFILIKIGLKNFILNRYGQSH